MGPTLEVDLAPRLHQEGGGGRRKGVEEEEEEEAAWQEEEQGGGRRGRSERGRSARRGRQSFRRGRS